MVQKEKISIRKRLAPIFHNTSEWLQKHGFQLKSFRIESEGEVLEGEANCQQELWTKHKVGVAPSSSHKGPKIKFTCGKSTTQNAEEENTTEEGQVVEEEPELELEEQLEQEEGAEIEKSGEDEQSREDQEEEEGNEEEERHDEEMKLSPQENIAEDPPHTSSPFISTTPHTPPLPTSPPPIAGLHTLKVTIHPSVHLVLSTPSIDSILQSIDVSSDSPSSIPCLSSSSYDISSQAKFDQFRESHFQIHQICRLPE